MKTPYDCDCPPTQGSHYADCPSREVICKLCGNEFMAGEMVYLEAEDSLVCDECYHAFVDDRCEWCGDKLQDDDELLCYKCWCSKEAAEARVRVHRFRKTAVSDLLKGGSDG